MLIFHGGEPLLGGLAQLLQYVTTVEEEFADSGIFCKMAIQSNGILFDKSIGELLLKKRINLGISIDGPPSVNDQYRVYHNGQGSTKDLEKKLALLSKPPYNSIFSGFLCVIDYRSDPIETLEYLAGFNPPSMDFLLPYDNWDNRPPGKEEFENTIYGDWLIRLFDHWFKYHGNILVKMFDSFFKVLLGGFSGLESIGLSPVDIIVVETNGDIEAVDSLKAAFEGATVLGYNVFAHSFDEVLNHVNVRARHTGLTSLCETCTECNVVEFCGGGYIPNRYSKTGGFQNPSIYCHDLEKLILHIHQTLQKQLAPLISTNEYAI